MLHSAADRFGGKEDFEVLPSKSDHGESSYHKHSLWMAHWTKENSSAEPQNGQSYSPFREISDVGNSKDCGTLPFGLMKAREAERLMVGLNPGGSSAVNTREFSSNMWGVAHDVCQEIQCKDIDQIDRSFERSMMQKNVNLYASKTVVSERFSIHKLSDLSMDPHKFLSSDNPSSEWSHFPMFAINRKINSILNPRRSAYVTPSDKISVPQNSVNINMSASNLMAFSSKEYQFHTHQVTENTSQCKSAGGIQSHPDNTTSLNSDHAGKKLKKHLSIEESCSCSKDETNSSSSMEDERHGNVCFANSEKAPRWSCEDKTVFSASKKENEVVEGSFLEQMYGGCQEQDLEGVVFPEPVKGREYENRPVKSSAISRGGDVDSSVHGMVFDKLLQGGQQHLCAAANLTESCKLPDEIEKKLTMKCNGEALARGKLTKDKKRKGLCLFEMLTRPTKSHSKDQTSPRKSYGNMGSFLLGEQKQFSSKTDTFYSETHHASKSTAGFASTSIRKESGCPNSAKSEGVENPLIKGMPSCSKGNESVNVPAEHHNSYSKATCAVKPEWSLTKTSSMNLDPVLFQISEIRNPLSNAPAESLVCSDPSDKWLKRLQRDISDPHLPSSKRPKVGDNPLPGGTCTVFGRVFDYDMKSTAMIDHVKEDKLVCETLMVQENQEVSPMPAKSLNSWIGRWCQGGTPVFHGSSNLDKPAPKSNMPPDHLEGQFPSIAAMAMMGRVMNKLRPCELQKRGPSVVWMTEGL